MPDKKYIYSSEKYGNIYYTGVIEDDNKDYTFNPDHFNELVNKGSYQEAKAYLSDYAYERPSTYNNMQETMEECDTWIRFNQRQYDLTSPEDKNAMDFIYQYDNDWENMDITNPYVINYNKSLNDLFQGSDKIKISFQKEKQKFLWIDALSKDNKDNNIRAYKKRLANNLGMESISDNYLKRNGIDVVYGDYDGSGDIIVDKSSPFLKYILESMNFGAYEPTIYYYSSNHKHTGNQRLFDEPGTSEWSLVPFDYFHSKAETIMNLVNDARNVKRSTILNDDYIYESEDYSLSFPGSEELETRINEGGTTGAAAKSIRDIYQQKLIGAMRGMLAGKQDIRVFDGPKDLMVVNENGTARRLTTDEQQKLFSYIPKDNSQITSYLNITNDGRFGFTFVFNGDQGSANVDPKPRIKFTVYDWNTEAISEIINANPKYKAVRKINEISKYNTTYESADGKYYTYLGGGYSGDAIYEDNDGNRISANELYDIATRDYMINGHINDIIGRNYTRRGNMIASDTDEFYKNLNLESTAAAINIASRILEKDIVDRDNKPLDVKTIAALINQDYNTLSNYIDLVLPEKSYKPLMYIYKVKTIIDSKLDNYAFQK